MGRHLQPVIERDSGDFFADNLGHPNELLTALGAVKRDAERRLEAIVFGVEPGTAVAARIAVFSGRNLRGAKYSLHFAAPLVPQRRKVRSATWIAPLRPGQGVNRDIDPELL